MAWRDVISLPVWRVWTRREHSGVFQDGVWACSLTRDFLLLPPAELSERAATLLGLNFEDALEKRKRDGGGQSIWVGMSVLAVAAHRLLNPSQMTRRKIMGM